MHDQSPFRPTSSPPVASNQELAYTLILKITKGAFLVEMMYGALDKRLVLPLSFLTNFVSTQMTHSKMLCSIVGSITPGGGYSHMVTWVNNFTRSVPVVPDVDIIYTGDNIQKIGKTWHLEAQSKQQTSVITNHI